MNVQDDNGNTPLHHAARVLNTPAIETLFQNGAHSNLQNHQGETPLHSVFALAMYTSRKEVAKVVEVFLRYRPHLDFVDTKGPSRNKSPI